MTSCRRPYKAVKSVVTAHGAQFVSIIDDLCDGDECPVVVKFESSFAPTTWDNAHLTEAGSIFIAKHLQAKLLPNLAND